MPFPRKRGGKNKAAAAPAKKPTPAKKPPANKRAPGNDSFEDKLSSLIEGSPGGNTSLVDETALEGLWSRPKHYIPTGSIAIDAAIGGPQPGLPSGRLTEISGPENIGKTTFLAALIAQAQRMGGLPVVVDSEHKMDLDRLRMLGVDLSRMPFEQVSTIEDVFEVLKYWAPKARAMLGPDVPILFAWDSVAGTPTRAEFNAAPGDKFRAEAAKVLKQEFRTCAQIVAQTQVTLVATNQIYAKMGNSFAPENETYGGGAIKYHATVRISLWFAGQMKPPGASAEDKVPPVGQLVKATIIKNQIAPPWRSKKYAIRYKEGIDNVWSLFEELVPHGVIEQNGSWFRLSAALQKELGIETRAWQGSHFGLNELINEHPALYAKLISIYSEKCRA